jgi:hypothetical protein
MLVIPYDSCPKTVYYPGSCTGRGQGVPAHKTGKLPAMHLFIYPSSVIEPAV